MSKKKNWFIGSDYLSSKFEKKEELFSFIKKNYNWLYSSKENFEFISQKIGLTKRDFTINIYKPEFKINNQF